MKFGTLIVVTNANIFSYSARADLIHKTAITSAVKKLFPMYMFFHTPRDVNYAFPWQRQPKKYRAKIIEF